MSDSPHPHNQTTLITGGAGFIGSNLTDALLERGERVICLDNFSDYYDPARKQANVAPHLENPNYTLVRGDLRDRDLIMRLFEEHRPTRVAHLAALAGVRASIEQATLYVEVNVQGTIHLMDAARQTGVENFVMASTSSIYGKTDRIPFREDQPTDRPLAPYPATKKACEVMGHAYHNMFGLNFTALRFFTVYGPRVRPDMMAYIVMDRIVHDQEITLYNQGDMYRDWTYVDDVIQGIVAALDTPLGYEVINIGRGEPIRLGDFVAIIEELVGKPARLNMQPAPLSEPPLTFACVDKAKALLGYQPHTSIREGLARTWAWYQTLGTASSVTG
ncbi:MAG TPA: SDR family NAD(P)-dependent oxidoreductase [Chloroflexi bacterium]|nr:SDR family NAD(P)-dependent oxidoreductase [Chloroflexota bacterium]